MMTMNNTDKKDQTDQKQPAPENTQSEFGRCVAAATCKMAAFCGGNCNVKLTSEK